MKNKMHVKFTDEEYKKIKAWLDAKREYTFISTAPSEMEIEDYATAKSEGARTLDFHGGSGRNE